MSESQPTSSSDETPRISDAEWVVMRALWKKGEATSGEIIGDLVEGTDWNPKTIRTLIGRLVQKGVVQFEQSGRERVYRPAIDERQCEMHASQSFLDRVFDGQLAPFLANFAERRGSLSDEDIAELRKLLEEGKNDG